jgi:ribosomal protein L40E
LVETLTESFCERCGTRYEFKAPTRLNPLRKTRGLFGGLKNYLTSQDALSDAMGDAMRSEEEQLAAAQLDAFHESFNFCIGCRQYTCVNCWNDAEGRCRNCAPVPGTDDLAERLAASFAGTGGQVLEPAPDAVSGYEPQPPVGLEAWPTTDMPVGGGTANGSPVADWPADDFATQVGREIEPEPEPVVAEVEPEPEPVVAEVEPEPVAAEVEPYVAEVEPEPEPVVVEVEPEPVAAEVEPYGAEVEPEPEPVVAEVEPAPRLLRVVAWDDDAAYEVEPESVVAEVEPEPEPESVVAEVEPEPEPESVVAEVEPEPEPPQPVRPFAPIRETIFHLPVRPTEAPAEEQPAVAATADESPEVAARRAQLDLLGLGDADQAAPPQQPAVLPYRSRGAAAGPIELAARAGGAGFWEASAREVAGAVANIGVQNCGQCGLSLSASARFCRRCGTRQARSA